MKKSLIFSSEELGIRNEEFFPRSHALRGNAYLRLNGVSNLYGQKAFVCVPTQERGNEKKGCA